MSLVFRLDIKDEVDLRRVHLLAPEDQPAQLKADLAVVDHHGGLTYTYEMTCQHMRRIHASSLSGSISRSPRRQRAVLSPLSSKSEWGEGAGEGARKTKTYAQRKQ